MTPNQIADHLVEMGIGFKQEFTEGPRYTLNLNRDHLDAESFIQDWRVAGKCLEAMAEANISVNIDGIHAQRYVEVFNMTDKKFPVVDIDKSLPKAICAAYCEATKDE